VADRVYKTLHYRRAVFSKNGPRPKKLEAYVGAAFKNLETVDDRTVEVQGRNYQGSAYAVKDHIGCFLHVSTYIEGDQASTVPTNGKVREADLQTTDAPDGTEFAEGDIHALISGDDVLFCATGLRDMSLKRYLDAVFDAEGVEVPYYEIKPAAKELALQMIAEGVKEVGINAAANRADLTHALTGGQGASIGGSIGQFFAAISGKDRKLSEALSSSNMNVGLSVRIEGRVGDDDDRLALLEKFGQYVIEDDEEEFFYIVTKSGTRITSRDISIKHSARMDKNGKSVFRTEAWASLEKMLQKLREDGMVDG